MRLSAAQQILTALRIRIKAHSAGVGSGHIEAEELEQGGFNEANESTLFSLQTPRLSRGLGWANEYYDWKREYPSVPVFINTSKQSVINLVIPPEYNKCYYRFEYICVIMLYYYYESNTSHPNKSTFPSSLRKYFLNFTISY